MELLPQLMTAAEENGFYLAFRQTVTVRNCGNGIHIPVSPEKDDALLLRQGGEKAVDGSAQGQFVHMLCGIVRTADALLQFHA